MNRKYDRAKQLTEVGAFAVCAAWLISYLITLVPWLTTPPYGIKDPPAGYSIESNGKYFRIVYPNSLADVKYHESYAEAVEDAWYSWEVRKRKEAPWRPVK